MRSQDENSEQGEKKGNLTRGIGPRGSFATSFEFALPVAFTAAHILHYIKARLSK
jgi:hypothetical protein